MHFVPVITAQFIRGMIDLAHTRIEAAHHAARARRLRQRQQRADADHGNVDAKCDALCDAACNAHAGKCTRAGPERNAVEIARGESTRAEQIIHHGQQQFRVTLSRHDLACVDPAVQPQRGGTQLGRGFERENFQWREREQVKPDFTR